MIATRARLFSAHAQSVRAAYNFNCKSPSEKPACSRRTSRRRRSRTSAVEANGPGSRSGAEQRQASSESWRKPRGMTTALEIFGEICIAIVVLQVVRYVLPWLWFNCVAPFVVRTDFKRFGRWAVVTGATDGIGKEYAKCLARKGLNIVLVGRSHIKLQATSREIENETKVQTQSICVDFKDGIEIYDAIEKQLAALDVGVLVNNVGVSYPGPDLFLDLAKWDELVASIVSVNILATLYMTRIVLKGMAERKRGLIVNLSSLAAVFPTPMLSVYAASKAFVDKFSDDLGTEYAPLGVHVQSLMPGPVATNMTKLRRATFLAPCPAHYASSAVRVATQVRHATGYLPHALFKVLFRNFFGFLSPVLQRRMAFARLQTVRERQRGKVGQV